LSGKEFQRDDAATAKAWLARYLCVLVIKKFPRVPAAAIAQQFWPDAFPDIWQTLYNQESKHGYTEHRCSQEFCLEGV